MSSIGVSFVIPLYNSAETIAPLVREIAALQIDGGHEIVLVDDGSSDRTVDVCQQLLTEIQVPIIFACHTRNFGEHNAVLTGLRLARGAYVVNLDDDGQNPPTEAKRLYEFARAQGLDVAFGHYTEKCHSAWRNLGSSVANRIMDWVLDKPPGLYLSSFRCVSAWVAREVASHNDPVPYIDGLILQVTQRIGTIETRHAPRSAGQSGYTIRKLVRLWLSTVVNSSMMPLRLATFLGIAMAATGLIGVVWMVALWRSGHGPIPGWITLSTVSLAEFGLQLTALGLIGEYLGRIFLTVHRRPQSVVRHVIRNAHCQN